MSIKIENDTLTLSNSHAGCMWVFASFFVVAFSIGGFLLWTDPSVDTPKWQIVLFTGFSILGLTLLVRQVGRGSLVRVIVNKRYGIIKVEHRSLKAKWQEKRYTRDVDQLLIEASDNDGEFFNCYIVFKDGEKLHVVHGNHRQGVMAECDKLQAFLEEAGAKIIRQEVDV